MSVKSFIMLLTMIVVIAAASVPAASDEGLSSERLQNIFTATLNLSDAQETQLRSVFETLNQDFERIVDTYNDDGFVGVRSLRDDIDDFLEEAAALFALPFRYTGR